MPGLTVSQFPPVTMPATAVHPSDPVPVLFDIWKVWAVGLVPDAVVKGREAGESTIVVAPDAAMTSVTATVCGVLLAPVAATWMEPVKVPALNPEIFAPTLKVVAPAPDDGETLNQAPLATDAVQFSVPPPELEIVTA